MGGACQSGPPAAHGAITKCWDPMMCCGWRPRGQPPACVLNSEQGPPERGCGYRADSAVWLLRPGDGLPSSVLIMNMLGCCTLTAALTPLQAAHTAAG